MQYDRYEKLVVVEKGVELVNWPDDVPFINASDIGSFHSLRRLLTALMLDDVDKRCRWVALTEDEWDKRREAYFESVANVEPRKHKRKAPVRDTHSDSSDGEDGEDGEVRPAKRTRKASTSGKENEAAAGKAKGKNKTAGRGKGKATGKAAGKGKGKAKKSQGNVPPVDVAANVTGNGPLAPVSNN